MRRFSFKVDLRKPKDMSAAKTQAPVPARDGFALSDSLGRQRRNMRQWPDYQRALRALPQVTSAADHFEDVELAEEYVRIYGVTRQKIMDAAPGFDSEGKTEIHCFFDDDGSKHLVSRLTVRPNARVTELSMYPSGEITRLYYENAGGPDQDLDELYQHGLAGLEDDAPRFARYPNYHLKFVLLPCEGPLLVDIYKGTCYYDEGTGTVATED
jgi:hypothetical protein